MDAITRGHRRARRRPARCSPFCSSRRLFRKVEQGKALIVSKLRKVDVTFTGQVVLPVLHKAEVMDISVKTIEITRAGKDGLICRDNIRADIRISFFVKVNKTVEDVIKVAQAVGTARASDRNTLQELFHAKFSEALKTVGKQLDFTDLYTKREELRYRIIEVIGVDLNGYHLEDAAIDYLEQTPLTQLDPANVLDAQGIRKITELTADRARAHQRGPAHRGEGDHPAERRRPRGHPGAGAPPGGRRDQAAREIETVRAREEAETARVVEEERLRAQGAFLQHRGAARRAAREPGPRGRRRREEPRAGHRHRERAHREGPAARSHRPGAGDAS